MKCPKCNQEIEDNVKFCTQCGINIAEEKERKAEEERKKERELEIKKQEAEDRKRLEEIRKQEELKREEEIKEAEKAEAIRKAKEEGIELEIIDKIPEPENSSNTEFKIKTEPEKKEKVKKEKKKKVIVKKNIFQVLLNKITFMIIVAAIIVGAVYCCYTQKLLPDFAQKEIEQFEHTIQNVIKLQKEVDNGKNTLSQTEEKQEWLIEPEIKADDIKDLTKEVSIIVRSNKEGLIDNKTGEIVLEPKYTQIEFASYYDVDKTEADKVEGIIVKDIEKYYKVDSKYQISTEVIRLASADKGAYFYDYHDAVVYYNDSNSKCEKAEKTKEKKLEICTDIDLVTTEGIAVKDAELPESFSIDFEKSTITTKGYCDTSKAELVINCDYDEAYDFSEGYAAVKTDDKAGIIDESGNKVIELKYEETRSVHDGAAFAKQDGKWGIIQVK